MTELNEDLIPNQIVTDAVNAIKDSDQEAACKKAKELWVSGYEAGKKSFLEDIKQTMLDGLKKD